MTISPLAGKPAPKELLKLVRWLRGGGVEAVEVLAHPVRPRQAGQ